MSDEKQKLPSRNGGKAFAKAVASAGWVSLIVYIWLIALKIIKPDIRLGTFIFLCFLGIGLYFTRKMYKQGSARSDKAPEG
jgi:uncharacterized membrane protein YczE